MAQRVCEQASGGERESEVDKNVIRDRQSNIGLSSGSN
jgi:hypothetical protein